MSDQTLANNHRYVTLHGRKPAPGVTTIINLINIPALPWSAAHISARESILRQDEYPLIAARHRSELIAKGKTVKCLMNEDVKVPAGYATDEEILVHYFRGQFDREWKAKAALGTRMHAYAERLANGIDIDNIIPEDVPYVDAWFRWYEENKPEFIFIERVVVDPEPNGDSALEYGGRMDAIVIFHAGPFQGLRLIDYKTGRHYLEPVALQHAGYGGAAGFATYDEMGRLSTLHPIPKLDGYVTVYLEGDGTYEMIDPYIFTTFERSRKAFLDLRSFYNHHLPLQEAWH